MTRPSLLILLPIVSLLVACEPSRIEQMSDLELSERYDYCLEKKPTAPGKAMACGNFRRECERRKIELGSYVCRSR